MTLKEILQLHHQYRSPHALSQSLGDAYLLKTNPVFRNIRMAAIEFGFRFQEKRFYHYDALPLTQLPKILSKKIIPYCDNVKALQEIEKIAPDVFQWEEVPPLRENLVMHESAHGVARELKKIYFRKNKDHAKLTASQKKVLETLLEEAFANAVECLANVYCQNEMDDEILQKNSYIKESSANRKAIVSAVHCIGIEATFRLLQLSYLHANFLKPKFEEKSFKAALKIIFMHDEDGIPKLSMKDQKVLQNAFKIGLSLDPAFTILTNSFCLRLMGLKESIYDLVNFDFLAAFENEKKYSTWLHVMSAVVGA